MIDCDTDLDLTPVQRVARMLAKGYPYGSHYLPHDAMATMTSGKTFLSELVSVGLRNCKVVLARMTSGLESTGCARFFRGLLSASPPANLDLKLSRTITRCERHRQVWRSTNPVHDWSSHASSALEVIAEAEMSGMLASAGSTANVQRRPVTVRTGFRGGDTNDQESSILDRFFGPPRRNVRVIR